MTIDERLDELLKIDTPQHVVRAVLVVAALGVAITAIAVAPGLGLLLRPFMQDRPVSNKALGQSVRRLERNGYIRRQTNGKSVRWDLTDKGRMRLDQFSLHEIQLSPVPTEWDQQWRIVLFDVPEERSYLRTVFRRKLKGLGFFYLQRSVWVYPFPCEREISSLAERLDLREHIHVALVSSLSSDARLRRRFQLTGSSPAIASAIPAESLATTNAEDTLPLTEYVD